MASAFSFPPATFFFPARTKAIIHIFRPGNRVCAYGFTLDSNIERSDHCFKIRMMARKGQNRRKKPGANDDSSGEAEVTLNDVYESIKPMRARNFDGNRVNTRFTTVSVREQIAYARYRKSGVDGPRQACGVPRTKFRRKKSLREIHVSVKDEVEVDEVPDIPAGKYSVGPPPIVFIDGYNLINQWARMKKRLERGDLYDARELLMDEVSEFASIRGWDCVVVFDAQGGKTNTVTREQARDGVEVVYTGSCSADAYIERQSFEACRLGKRQVWAATSDFAQQKVTGGQGAHVLSASRFVEEVNCAKKEIRKRMKIERSITSGKSERIIEAVDSATRERLYALRDKLGWRARNDK